MMWGVDRLSSGHLGWLRKCLRNAPSALLTHHAAVDRRGIDAITALESLGVRPKVVFSPEHGLDGVAQAEEPVDSVEADEGRPRVVSLYGSSKESLSPSTEDLDGVETLVIDLVDVGARYYTYVWTALLAVRAAAELGIHSVVLDRPNPLGGSARAMEGKPQREGFLSFVGLEPVPIRHSLTLGELLSVCLERDGKALGREGVLSVVGCVGWERDRTAAAWGRPFVPPSPNMPSLETALLYPGGCLVEGTNLSEGRGTAMPFRVIGAPFIDDERLARDLVSCDLPGVWVRPATFRPSFEKHAGSVCRGVMLHPVDDSFRPVQTFLTLLCLARSQAEEAFEFLDRVYEFEHDTKAFDLLCGSAEPREAMLAGAAPEDVVALLAPLAPDELSLPLRAEALAEAAGA